jgi:hypothetical protein
MSNIGQTQDFERCIMLAITPRTQEPRRGPIVKANFAWQEVYEAAVVETKLEEMEPRLRVAKAAIDARRHKLQLDHGGTREERLAIGDALAGLSLLRRERETRAHDTDSTKGPAE